MFFPKIIKMRKIIQVTNGKNYKISLDEEEIKSLLNSIIGDA